MGLPEFDVSSDRLQMRPRIEQEIHKLFCHRGFERVEDFSSTTKTETEKDTNGGGVNGEEGRPRVEAANKTTWNRSIWLYQRVLTPSTLLENKQQEQTIGD